MITAEDLLISPHRLARPEIRVHPACADDFDDIQRVLAAAYAEFEPVLGPALHGAYLADLLDLGGRSGGQLLVAKVGRHVAGTVTFFPDAAEQGLGWPSGWAGVRALAVDPSSRGLGIARRLMAECMRRADAAGADVICLHTAEFMSSAVRLYAGLGFERIPDYDFDAAAHYGAEHRSVRGIAYARPVAPSAIRRRPVDR